MSTPITYRDMLLDRYRWVYDRTPPVGRVLDVGCGNGHFTKWLLGRADEVWGVDHTPRNCREAHANYPRLRLAASAGEHLPFENASFDCVICSDTLEHTDDDQRTIDELLRVLRPGGTMLITTPQGGLFGWLDAENLVNYPFVLVKALHLPKPGGGYRLESFTYRVHRHYTLARMQALIGQRATTEEVHRGGLFLYPFLYLIEKSLESFFGIDLCRTDYRWLRRLRDFDYRLPFGPVAFNLAVQLRKDRGV